MRRKSLAWLVAALVLTGAACSGGNNEPLVPAATLPQGTTTTNPYAVPPVIDEAYVNRVLAGLDAAVGDITRMIVAENMISGTAVDQVSALYLDEAMVLKLQLYQSDVLRNFAGYKNPPGNRTTTVTELITARSDCIFARINKDVTSVSLAPDPRFATQWVALVPLDRTRDKIGFNRVGWIFNYEGFSQDLSAPPNQCEN